MSDIEELPEEGWRVLLGFKHRKLSGQLVMLNGRGGAVGAFDYIEPALLNAAPGSVLLWAWHGNYRTNVFALKTDDLRARYIRLVYIWMSS